MQSDHDKHIYAAALGQRGGQVRAERLTAQERSAISRHAAWSRHHPREAQEQAYLIQQILKNSRQLPLV